MEFPLDYVRGCFSSLEESDTVYFDSLSEPRCLDTVRSLRESNTLEDSPEEIVRETRESLAFFLNSNGAWSEEEILFAPNAAELARRLSVALTKSMEPGSEILVTELDDEWNLAPWLTLGNGDLEVKFWPIKRAGAGLEVSRLDELFTERTRLLVMTKASSAVGTIVELLPIALRARDRRSILVVNWTPFLAHGALDVRFLRADFVVAGTEPLFGSRVGFLWGKRERMRELRAGAPELFEGLDVDAKDVACLGAALRYVEELGLLSHDMQIQPSEDYGRRRHMRRGMQAIRHYEHALSTVALRRLATVPGLTIFGIGEPDGSAHRTPSLYFGIRGMEPAAVASELAKRNIRVGHGNCGSPRLVKALGLSEDTGAVCAALAHYNTEAEVERFAEALHEIAHA